MEVVRGGKCKQGRVCLLGAGTLVSREGISADVRFPPRPPMNLVSKQHALAPTSSKSTNVGHGRILYRAKFVARRNLNAAASSHARTILLEASPAGSSCLNLK
ncbi:hypothetical protein PMIN03_007565 [Paraphaeosphaeria minitans]